MKLRNLLLDAAVEPSELGKSMHELASELWPIARSITGPGVRKTLEILQREIPELTVGSIPSGTKCFDWTIPEEWSISEAFIEDESGHRILDFQNNNLHVVGYSVPVDEWLDLPQLQSHLHSLPEQPNAIPYVTSYRLCNRDAIVRSSRVNCSQAF
jgi:aminopeptidase-like protein